MLLKISAFLASKQISAFLREKGRRLIIDFEKNILKQQEQKAIIFKKAKKITKAFSE